MDAVINPISNGKGLVMTFQSSIYTLKCQTNAGKENKQEGQCAQSKGQFLSMWLYQDLFTKFLFNIANSPWQNLQNEACYVPVL
jgi:hypothetical protein